MGVLVGRINVLIKKRSQRSHLSPYSMQTAGRWRSPSQEASTYLPEANPGASLACVLRSAELGNNRVLLKPCSSTPRDSWCLVSHLVLSEFLGIYFRITENKRLLRCEPLPQEE